MKILIAILILEIIVIIGSLKTSTESRNYVRIGDNRLFRPLAMGSAGHDIRAMYSDEPRAKRSV